MRTMLVLTALTCAVQTASSQFSPGELSRPHMDLEGTQNCAQCHEVGKEISGVKCLTCHTVIKNAIDAQRGYHFTVSSQKCVTCHKEHLGRDVQTVLFDRKTFDHTTTGFALQGKHAAAPCERCHILAHIKSPEVRALITKTKRTTFLGLDRTCVSCHEDRHKGAFGTDCQSCHTSSAWSPTTNFDHSRTRFALKGKHAGVRCAQCHTGMSSGARDRTAGFSTKSYSDCTPCHASPHGGKFARRQCMLCHSPEGWPVTEAQRFDHNLTGFKLLGRHVSVSCQQCHKRTGKTSFTGTYKMPHAKCTDCHTDYHEGESTVAYRDDCTRCHTVDFFTPSLFSFQDHSTLRFALSGAHAATPCYSCHTKSAAGRRIFHRSDVRCASCHEDRHAGQFNNMMVGQSCGACHSTSAWKPATFDHSRTRFPLTGKHASAPCDRCHTPRKTKNTLAVQYRGTATQCRSCHNDVHAGQFAVGGTTECSTCHTPEGWRLLVFDHNTRSSFPLTGAHKKIACWTCHKEESVAGQRVRRFKPLSTRCESCHKESDVHNE